MNWLFYDSILKDENHYTDHAVGSKMKVGDLAQCKLARHAGDVFQEDKFPNI